MSGTFARNSRSQAPPQTPFSYWSTRNSTAPGESSAGKSAADRADRLFVAINQSLRTIESEQLSRINTLAEDAYQTADAISNVLEGAGLEG